MNDWSRLTPYGVEAASKTPWLLAQLNGLTQHHYQNSLYYRHILEGQSLSGYADRLEDVPFVAARLFKMLPLVSVEPQHIFKTLTSSGTTSQVKSSIVLDKETAALQSKVLVSLLSHFTGKTRRPMLIIDHNGLTSDKSGFSARGAGVQGLSFLGRDHTYALNADLTLNGPEIERFSAQYAGESVLIFGFTFMVWQYFLKPLFAAGHQGLFKDAILFHSGGWKKMQQQAVTNRVFKTKALQVLGNQTAIHNFYGMVEQVGTVFVECEQGHLHAPTYADIIVRHQQTLHPVENGIVGQIQVLSFLPKSYPGHSILTEDIGRILGEDDCSCGLKGKYFEVQGRLAQTEIRGCSDTI